jgi:transcriptional regulator with XRE-family HTH domain
MQDRMTFAALLSQAMGAANLTRAELAKRSHVRRAAVHKWLSGVQDGDQRKAVLPSPPVLARILDAMPEDARPRLRDAYLRAKHLA